MIAYARRRTCDLFRSNVFRYARVDEGNRGAQRVPEGSFAHLQYLPIEQEAVQRIIELLRDSERFHDASPQVAIYLCRTALEGLCRAVERSRNLGGDHFVTRGQAERFDSIIAHCEGTGRWQEARVWKEYRFRNGRWNRVTHGQAMATAADALLELQFWHSMSWRLCFLSTPALGETVPRYVRPIGIQSEIESYRSGAVNRGLEERLQKEEELRRAAERRVKDATERLHDAERSIQEAKAASDQLHAQLALSNSSALERELEIATAKLHELEQDCDRLRDEVDLSEALQADISRELERLRQAEQSKDEQLVGMRAELDRMRALESEKAVSEQAARLHAARADEELAKARAENEYLREQQQDSPASEKLQALLRQSEHRVRELVQKGQGLVQDVERYREEREAAVARAGDLESQVARLRDEIAEEAEGRAGLERAEARRSRYERDYPGVEQAHEFFRAAIEGDQDGPLPPLSALKNFLDLGSDRYARRFQASHASEACTVRVISLQDGVPDEERCRAWKVEEWNLSRSDILLGHGGIARLILACEREKPGFCVFARPTCSLLSEFGSLGKTLRISSALRFAEGLIEDLAARARARMSVSWPDLHAIGVCQGKSVMLEPTAPHFGDLGPPRYLGKSAADCVYLGRDELESGWTFAVSHALLRLTGAISRSAPASACLGSHTEQSLQLHLEECRRACDQPIALVPLRELAGTLIAATSATSEAQPALEELLRAIRAPLTER